MIENILAAIMTAIETAYEWLRGTYLSVGQVIGLMLVLSMVHIEVSALIHDEPMFYITRKNGKRYTFYARSGLKEDK